MERRKEEGGGSVGHVTNKFSNFLSSLSRMRRFPGKLDEDLTMEKMGSVLFCVCVDVPLSGQNSCV